MKKRPLLLLFAISLPVLGGCSKIGLDQVLPDKRTKYRKSQALPDLEVPPDLTLTPGENAMQIPGEGGETNTMSGFYEQKAQRAAKTGSALDDEWMTVLGALPTLWPKMESYWTTRDFILDLNDPELGILETEWHEPEASPEDEARERHKFTVYSEPVPGADSVQILVSGRSEEWGGSEWETVLDSEYAEKIRKEFSRHISTPDSKVSEDENGSPSADETQIPDLPL